MDSYKTLLTDAIRKITEAREIWMFHHGEDVDADWCADMFDSTTDRLKQMIHWEDDTQTTPWGDAQ